MGSMVLKIDNETKASIQSIRNYVDIDMFRYDTTDGDLPLVYDVEAVKQSVRNILMWRVGESILYPNFGHNLYASMYQQLNEFNKDKVAQEIQRAIEDNEPRVKVISVAAKVDDSNDDDNKLLVRVVYEVVGNKSKDSQFVEETTISGK